MTFEDIAEASVTFDREFFKTLPKTDLHVHLDGSLRLKTIMELAELDNIDVGAENIESLEAAIGPGRVHSSLENYLKSFATTLKVLQTDHGLYRVTHELAEDAAKENIEYMEVRFAPILHTRKKLSLAAILESVLLAIRDASRDFGIQIGVIVCGIRNISPSFSLRLAELAAAFKNRGVVGFDLAGSEYNYPAKDHLAAFSLILSNNVNVTIHAGEAYGPESIHQALHYCGAHRLGHGTRLKENGELLNYVNDHRIPLEICMSSNIQTQAVRKLEEHPFRFYLDLGLRVTLNTDNRLITNTTMTNEYCLAYEEFDFTPREILTIVMNGVKSAFIPYEIKRELIQRTKATTKDMLVNYVKKHGYKDQTSSNSNNYA